MTIGNTSELGDKDELTAEPGQIVKTPPVPLLPVSATVSASSTYLLNQDIDSISDGTDDGVSDGTDDGSVLDGTELGVVVKVKPGNKQESASKGRHNQDPSSKMCLQIPLPPTFSFIWLLR
eukprot:8145534-Ditylum_brightwellii.AAC.1